MILFIVSFLLIFLSSYFITSIIAPKKSILGVIYLFMLAFAQIVFTFEFLSFFNEIRPLPVLEMNILIMLVSALIWSRRNKPVWWLDCSEFKNRVLNSMRLDKCLFFLYFSFCVFLIASIFLCLIMPISSADAQSYHVARSLFWVFQGSLKHFATSDIRCLCLPINSEILYSWVILFVKKDVFLGFFGLIGYALSVISIYNILGYLGYCTRKKLWVIFVLASFPSVIVQASGTETDIIIVGLILSCIFLYWTALRTKKITPVVMASLAYALAVGTKTPALLMIPGTALLLLALSGHYKNIKYFAYFALFFVINFFVFASYNYILNYLQFGNFLSPDSFMIVSKNYFGIKGALASIIKYIFMFIDASGIKFASVFNADIVNFRKLALDFLQFQYIKDGAYTLQYKLNTTLLEPVMGAGPFCLLLFIPCVLISILKPIFNFVKTKCIHKKSIFLFAFAAIFILNLLIISYSLAFMSYNVRFIMSFIVFSSPILVYSYLSSKNPLKYVLVTLMTVYIFVVTTHFWGRPLFKVVNILIKHPSLSYIREVTACKTFDSADSAEYAVPECYLVRNIKANYKTNNRFLIFMNCSSSLYMVKALAFDGYKIDFALLEDAHKINFKKYNIVISPLTQRSTVIKDYENRKKDYRIVGKNVQILKHDSVPCFYSKNLTLSNAMQMPPYQVRCMLKDEFIAQNHFYFGGYAGLMSPPKEEEDRDLFYFYINKALPINYKVNSRLRFGNSLSK